MTVQNLSGEVTGRGIEGGWTLRHATVRHGASWNILNSPAAIRVLVSCETGVKDIVFPYVVVHTEVTESGYRDLATREFLRKGLVALSARASIGPDGKPDLV